MRKLVRKSLTLLAVAAVVSQPLACERSAPPPQVSPGTPAAPATSLSLAEVVKARVPVVMTIDQDQKDFPPAKLVMESRDGKSVVLLMSDDPPQAINDDYVGNSYYLELEFDEIVPDLAGRQWECHNSAASATDEPTGIYLEGHRKHLQPRDVKVTFERGSSGEIAWLSGTFLMIDTTDVAVPPRLVPVTAKVTIGFPRAK